MSFFDLFKKKKKEVPVASEALIAAVKALERCEILLVPDPSAEPTSPTASKLGGKPYLPSDFVWPTYTSADDGVTRPLSFFCQINLREVKPYDREGLLPERGMLYFFYECESFCWGFDPRDLGAARVFWYDTTDALDCAPLDIPAAVAEEHVIPEIALSFCVRPSYPSFEELELHAELDCEWEEYDLARAALGKCVDEDPEDHKLLGFADVIQDEMLSECERTSRGLDCGSPESYQSTSEQDDEDIRKRATDWTLLLQLSTITKGDFEWMFGDCGMLYFYIRRDDLAAMRFDQARFCLQCG